MPRSPFCVFVDPVRHRSGRRSCQRNKRPGVPTLAPPYTRGIPRAAQPGARPTRHVAGPAMDATPAGCSSAPHPLARDAARCSGESPRLI
jgi:hypothetical protein